jgi:hypothetical protein
MAKRTISDAARVAGVACSTLHRAIHAGRLSIDVTAVSTPLNCCVPATRSSGARNRGTLLLDSRVVECEAVVY